MLTICVKRFTVLLFEVSSNSCTSFVMSRWQWPFLKMLLTYCTHKVKFESIIYYLPMLFWWPSLHTAEHKTLLMVKDISAGLIFDQHEVTCHSATCWPPLRNHGPLHQSQALMLPSAFCIYLNSAIQPCSLSATSVFLQGMWFGITIPACGSLSPDVSALWFTMVDSSYTKDLHLQESVVDSSLTPLTSSYFRSADKVLAEVM